MEKNNTGVIISAAVFALVGVILIGVLSSEVTDKTQLVSVTDSVSIASARSTTDFRAINESYTFSAGSILTQSAGTSFKTDISECAISSVVFKNQTGATLTADTDYVWVTDGNGAVGTLQLKNVKNVNVSGSNATTITYSYCQDDYVYGWARTVTNMTPGFFALAILAGLLFVVMYFMKEYI